MSRASAISRAAAVAAVGAALSTSMISTLPLARAGELTSFRPWDLAYILPLHATPSEVEQLLKLTDLGYSQAEFQAMIDHISQQSLLPESEGQDADNLSAFHNGQKVLGGAINDREGHNSVGSDPNKAATPFDAGGKAANDCFKDPNAWRMVQMRIGPYKIQPSGTPVEFINWAKAQGKPIDRIIQVRIAFRPYCAVNGSELAPLADAIHFAFELRPSDPNLLRDAAYAAAVKNPAQTTSQVWGQSQNFMNASNGNQAAPAMAALRNHLAALNSPDYLAFRAYVLKDIAKLAATRANLGPTPFKAMNQALDELRTNLAFPAATLLGDGLPSFAHPGLRSGAENREALLAAVNAFAKKYGTRGNVTAIAGFATEADGKAYYSNFGMGGIGDPRQLPSDAQGKLDYKLIHPNGLSTTVARTEGSFIHLFPGKTATLYAQADAVGDNQESGFAFRASSSSTPVELIDSVDLASSFTQETAGNGDKSIVFSPLFPANGPALSTQLSRLASPRQTLPSTTSCVSCHLLPRVGISAPGGLQILHPAQPNFLLLNEASLTVRTQGELDHESMKLNLEWNAEWTSSPLATCDESKAGALRDCLDAGDASTQGTTACLSQFCAK